MQGPEKLNNISFPEASMSSEGHKYTKGKINVHVHQEKSYLLFKIRDNSFIGSSITGLYCANLTQENN